jgi:LPS O-antigen subunit length determinant protein (WzzB/FepE family)
MEEIEVPTEHLHEQINEHAKEHKEEKNWSYMVAISTALMAVFAAISSLMAGHYSNEALIEQIRASDQWAYYQAKGIKAEIASLRTAVDSSVFTKYKNEQKQIQEIAREDEAKSKLFLDKHVVLARSVTFFQIAIAISAISILTGRRTLWYGAILLTVTGLVFFVANFLG